MIAGLPRPWVHSFIAGEMWPLVENGDDEEYRRFAELLTEIGPAELLAELLQRAGKSDNPDIREVVEDFPGGGRSSPAGDPATRSSSAPLRP